MRRSVGSDLHASRGAQTVNVEARSRPGGAGEVAPNANHAKHKDIRERVEGGATAASGCIVTRAARPTEERAEFTVS